MIVGALLPEVIQNDFDSVAAELLLEGILENITALTEDIENQSPIQEYLSYARSHHDA